MDLFLLIVLFLALSSPVLAIILYKIAKKNKLTVTYLSLENDNLKKDRDSLTNQLIESDKKIAQAIREHSELEGRAAPLWQYAELHSAVLDAEKKIKTADSIAKHKIEEAQIMAAKTVNEAHNQAQLTISNANSEAIAITKDARDARLKAKERLDNANSKANELISNANDNAVKIISNAEERAKEIAGSAYEAKEFAERYESVAKSMKNKIEGYGESPQV